MNTNRDLQNLKKVRRKRKTNVERNSVFFSLQRNRITTLILARILQPRVQFETGKERIKFYLNKILT